jgi:hypothetical protein
MIKNIRGLICRIVGHGVEAEDETLCCAHCARESGMRGVEDRV